MLIAPCASTIAGAATVAAPASAARFRNLRRVDAASDILFLPVSCLLCGLGIPQAGRGKEASVFVIVADPVESNLVASLSKPGGNLTGLSNMFRNFRRSA